MQHIVIITFINMEATAMSCDVAVVELSFEERAGLFVIDVVSI